MTKKELAKRKALKTAKVYEGKQEIIQARSAYLLTSIHGSKKAERYRATTSVMRKKPTIIKRSQCLEYCPIDRSSLELSNSE